MEILKPLGHFFKHQPQEVDLRLQGFHPPEREWEGGLVPLQAGHPGAGRCYLDVDLVLREVGRHDEVEG